jgi:hypothetical protein
MYIKIMLLIKMYQILKFCVKKLRPCKFYELSCVTQNVAKLYNTMPESALLVVKYEHIKRLVQYS